MKLQLLSTALLLAFSGQTFAASKYLSCSSHSGFFKLAGSDKDLKVTISTVTLAGPTVIELDRKDLNLVEGKRQAIESSSSSSQTICNIPMNVKTKVFVRKISINKKNGTPIIQDDTPQSSPKDLTAILLCEERTVDAWPCP